MNKNIKRLFFAMAFMSALSAFSYVDSYALGEGRSDATGGTTGEKSTDVSSEDTTPTEGSAVLNSGDLNNSVNTDTQNSSNTEDSNSELKKVDIAYTDGEEDDQKYIEETLKNGDNEVYVPYTEKTVDIIVENDTEKNDAIEKIKASYKKQAERLKYTMEKKKEYKDMFNSTTNVTDTKLDTEQKEYWKKVFEERILNKVDSVFTMIDENRSAEDAIGVKIIKSKYGEMTYKEAKENGLYDSNKNGTPLDYKEGEKYYLLAKGDSFEYTKVLRNPDTGEWVNFRFTITGINLDPNRKKAGDGMDISNDSVFMNPIDLERSKTYKGEGGSTISRYTPLEPGLVRNRMILWPSSVADLQIKIDFVDDEGREVYLNPLIFFTDIDAGQGVQLMNLYNKDVAYNVDTEKYDTEKTYADFEENNNGNVHAFAFTNRDNPSSSDYYYRADKKNIFAGTTSTFEDDPFGWVIYSVEGKYTGFEYRFFSSDRSGNSYIYGALQGIGDTSKNLNSLLDIFRYTKYNLYEKEKSDSPLKADILIGDDTENKSVYTIKSPTSDIKYDVKIDLSDLKDDINSSLERIKSSTVNNTYFLEGLKRILNDESKAKLEGYKNIVDEGDLRLMFTNNSYELEKDTEFRYSFEFDLPEGIDYLGDNISEYVSLEDVIDKDVSPKVDADTMPISDGDKDSDSTSASTASKSNNSASPWKLENISVEDYKDSDGNIFKKLRADIVLNLDYFYSDGDGSTTLKSFREALDRLGDSVNLYINAKPSKNFTVGKNYTARTKIESNNEIGIDSSYLDENLKSLDLKNKGGLSLTDSEMTFRSRVLMSSKDDASQSEGGRDYILDSKEIGNKIYFTLRYTNNPTYIPTNPNNTPDKPSINKNPDSKPDNHDGSTKTVIPNKNSSSPNHNNIDNHNNNTDSVLVDIPESNSINSSTITYSNKRSSGIYTKGADFDRSRLPKTNDSGVVGMIISSLGSLATIIGVNKKRK